jgi:hypothetical protein
VDGVGVEGTERASFRDFDVGDEGPREYVFFFLLRVEGKREPLLVVRGDDVEYVPDRLFSVEMFKFIIPVDRERCTEDGRCGVVRPLSPRSRALPRGLPGFIDMPLRSSPRSPRRPLPAL